MEDFKSRIKIPRRKALSSLEDNVLTILIEEGYVNKDETFVVVEPVPGVFKDEDEDEELVVDGEVDKGDIHIKPVSKRPTPLLFFEVDVKLVFKEGRCEVGVQVSYIQILEETYSGGWKRYMISIRGLKVVIYGVRTTSVENASNLKKK